MNEKMLYIVGGANGSGKTTFAIEFCKQKNLPFVNADEIAKLLNPEQIDHVKLTAGKQFFSLVDEYFEQDVSFVIESTLSGKYLVKLINRAKLLGYRFHLTYLYLDDVEINVYRVKNRVAMGGHNVPETDIRRRYTRSFSNFWTHYRKQSDEWILYDNSNLPKEVARGIEEAIFIHDELLYYSFLKELNYDT